MTMYEDFDDMNPLGLPDFEGQAVAEVGVEISNASGGLNESLKVEPQTWQHGESVFIVLRCDVTKVRFDPVKTREDQLRRVHIMRATDAAVAPADMLDKLEQTVNESRSRIIASRQTGGTGSSLSEALAALEGDFSYRGDDEG